MSLSKLERDAVLAEEQRVVMLRERERAKAKDEDKLQKQTAEELAEHARFCVKGASATQPYSPASSPLTASSRLQRWRTTSGTTKTGRGCLAGRCS